MWKCNGCEWTGDELVPVKVSAGIQGMVNSSACPVCGKTVGEDVFIQEAEEEPIPVIDEAVEADPVEETPEFICQYCDKVCKSLTGQISHEKACIKNPDNM